MHYYNFNIGDYMKHTLHLTPEEDLAYRRLLDMYYDTEAPIPNAIPLVSRRLRMDSKIVESVLNEFFDLTEEGYKNYRADGEIADYHKFLEKQKANGRLGGRPKKGKKPIGNPAITQTEAKISLNNKQQTTNNNQSIAPIGFDLFWNSYNKKVGKPNSLKAWSKIKFTDGLLEKIVEKAKADAIAKPDSKFRKDPERWLKGQHWLDEVVIAQAPESKELPLGNDQQIEAAYRAECGDPAKSRFNSYYEMRAFIVAQREKRKVA
jgi:uncharacterized protein YdaU (DUF1376 family)